MNISPMTNLDYRNQVNKIMGIAPVAKNSSNINKDAEIKRLEKELKKAKSDNGNVRDRLHHALHEINTKKA